MQRPYYKPAAMERYSRYDDGCNPLLIALAAVGGFGVTIALAAMWLLCVI